MKVVFACIVLNGNYVLKELIESIYPYAHKIIFISGPVRYWISQGVVKSTDGTQEIIREFPDPKNKIILGEGLFEEKTQMGQAFMKFVPEDTDYIWCVDSDEIFKQKDIEKTIEVLEDLRPESISFNSNTFFGGFENIISGFEAQHDFKRILRYEPGCEYVQHRQPTLSCEYKQAYHIKGNAMNELGVRMYHYSYAFPKQVYEKIQYYEKAVISSGNCIENYFTQVWLAWVNGDAKQRNEIEQKYKGVHEFKPGTRGEAFTQPFLDHPEIIKKSLPALKEKFNEQLKFYTEKFETQ